MNILDTFKRFTQPYSDDDYENYDDDEGYEEEESQEPAPRPRRSSPFSTGKDADSDYSAPASSGFNAQVVNMGSGKQDVVLFHVKAFDDAAQAADELRRKKAVILNMENIEKSLTRRVVDFLTGSVYALDGSVKKIAQSTYLFCPHNMNVVGDLEHVQGEI